MGVRRGTGGQELRTILGRCPLTRMYSPQPDRPPTKLQTSSTVHLLMSSGAVASSPSLKSPPMAPGWEVELLGLRLPFFPGSHPSADLCPCPDP